MTEMNLSNNDLDYIIALGSSASLAKTPEKDNWVDYAGELPKYIREVARSIHEKGGKTLSQAIAIAISRMKKWAVSGEADTKAKAAKALAEWEALKAKSKAKKVAKLSNRTGLMEPVLRPVEIIALSGPSYSMDTVRSEFDKKIRAARRSKPFDSESPFDYMYVQEVWNTHLIVRGDYGNDDLYKVDYTVDSNGNVTFGDPVKVVVEYVEAGKDITDDQLTSALS